MHAGPEYKLKPNGTQKKFSKMVIDAGADAVIGHHSHWAGEIIFYKQKPIVYSLGNLIFDQNWQYFT
jgi:poly-gamma-glutamate synthesis protein (capsule biosynthesis protein)